MITTMSQALTFISEIEAMHPKADNIRASFNEVPLFEMEQLAKQENLVIEEKDGMKGLFFWKNSNCYVFWNETKK